MTESCIKIYSSLYDEHITCSVFVHSAPGYSLRLHDAGTRCSVESGVLRIVCAGMVIFDVTRLCDLGLGALAPLAAIPCVLQPTPDVERQLDQHVPVRGYSF
jgi:hypothetical protein